MFNQYYMYSYVYGSYQPFVMSDCSDTVYGQQQF